MEVIYTEIRKYTRKLFEQHGSCSYSIHAITKFLQGKSEHTTLYLKRFVWYCNYVSQ